MYILLDQKKRLEHHTQMHYDMIEWDHTWAVEIKTGRTHQPDENKTYIN